MARITVEDCLKKIDSQYDLVLLAKERTSQLNAGEKPLLPEDRDKHTVIALREIAESKISIKNLEDSAIDKLRAHQEDTTKLDEFEDEQEDSFEAHFDVEFDGLKGLNKFRESSYFIENNIGITILDNHGLI